VAENKKNGKINKPAHKFAKILGDSVVILAALNANKIIKLCLKTLSLNAPKNWVQKNGKKRLVFSRSN
jgi:hypothetical protein